MNYIPAERFLELSEKVQKVFMDWWQPQECDIYSYYSDVKKYIAY